MFNTIYGWFSSLYGVDLDDYLIGFTRMVNAEGDPVWEANHYVMFGFIALGIALFIAITYYYIINSALFNKIWSWLTMLLITGLVNLFIGAGVLISRLNSGEIDRCLDEIAQDGTEIYLNSVTIADCWMFGLANLFVSVAFFIIISLIIKWGSSICKRSPF